jgi:hypothetical protein
MQSHDDTSKTGTAGRQGATAAPVLRGQMYDTSDDQVRSLLENRLLLRRALMYGAREAAAGDADGAIARVVCWIMAADEQLKEERSRA